VDWPFSGTPQQLSTYWERIYFKWLKKSEGQGRSPVNINTTFIALIPKVDYPETFEGFRPISLCNCLYKIISKVLVVRLKPLLSNFILAEQFGFLEGRKIHESIGTTQEGLHSINLSNDPVVVVKLDLSKAYDKVS
jgi:hypothetical protein